MKSHPFILKSTCKLGLLIPIFILISVLTSAQSKNAPIKKNAIKTVVLKKAIPHDTCLSKEEAELFALVNQYRQEKGKWKLKYSKSLAYVAKAHAQDVFENQNAIINDTCNLHSWSAKGNWKPVCYTRNHKFASLMWSKPKELTHYKGNGYEISAQTTGIMSAKDAIALWKTSSGHNDVMLSQGVFSITHFNVMGLAIVNGYACIWFGEEKDGDFENPCIY